jgi:hypothetical protein
MRKYLVLLLLALVLVCCKKEAVTGPGNPPPPPPPPPPVAVPAVLLKEITASNVPTPYFFEYDAVGRAKTVIVASGLRIYEVVYSGKVISEMKNNTMVNKDRLLYVYNNAGKVSSINYMNEAGFIFRKAHFTYDGQKLSKIDWEKNTATGFVVDRRVALVYQPDGNVMEMADERLQAPGQPAITLLSRFEQYDTKINSDGFALFHDQNDHLLLLPGIQLQKNNPGKFTHTGGFDFKIDYTYTYNDKNVPLTRKGDVVILNGPNAGQAFQINSAYSYY